MASWNQQVPRIFLISFIFLVSKSNYIGTRQEIHQSVDGLFVQYESHVSFDIQEIEGLFTLNMSPFAPVPLHLILLHLNSFLPGPTAPPGWPAFNYLSNLSLIVTVSGKPSSATGLEQAHQEVLVWFLLPLQYNYVSLPAFRCLLSLSTTWTMSFPHCTPRQ